MKDLFVCISCTLVGILIGMMMAFPVVIKAFVDNLEATPGYCIEDGRDDVFVTFKLGPFMYRKVIDRPKK